MIEQAKGPPHSVPAYSHLLSFPMTREHQELKASVGIRGDTPAWMAVRQLVRGPRFQSWFLPLKLYDPRACDT